LLPPAAHGRADRGDQILHERIREDKDDDPGDDGNDRRPGNHRGGELPRRIFIAIEQTAEYGNKGRSERPGHDQQKQQVRDSEGTEVGVVVATRAELASDNEFAKKSDQAAADGKHRHDSNIAADRMRGIRQIPRRPGKRAPFCDHPASASFMSA
jgi:hypothetical protein